MKMAISFCVAMLMFNGPQPGSSQTNPPALTELTKWQGKYFFDKVGGRKLLANAELRKLLVATLGEAEAKRFYYYSENGPSGPVGVLENYVFLDACMAHNCSDESFTVIVDTKASQAFVCRATDRSSAKGEVIWRTAGRTPVTAKDCGVGGDSTPASYRQLLKMIPTSLRE